MNQQNRTAQPIPVVNPPGTPSTHMRTGLNPMPVTAGQAVVGAALADETPAVTSTGSVAVGETVQLTAVHWWPGDVEKNTPPALASNTPAVDHYKIYLWWLGREQHPSNFDLRGFDSAEGHIAAALGRTDHSPRPRAEIEKLIRDLNEGAP